MIPKLRNKGDPLLSFIAELPTGISMVEVGVFAGESSEMFLRSGKISSYVAVDTWYGGYDQNDPVSNCDAGEMRQARMEFYRRVSPWKSIVTVMEMPSLEAAGTLKGKGMRYDMVYIDAAHTAVAVRSDVDAWRPLVVLGGILAGHDIHFKQVKAVVSSLGLPVKEYADSSWRVDLPRGT